MFVGATLPMLDALAEPRRRVPTVSLVYVAMVAAVTVLVTPEPGRGHSAGAAAVVIVSSDVACILIAWRLHGQLTGVRMTGTERRSHLLSRRGPEARLAVSCHSSPIAAIVQRQTKTPIARSHPTMIMVITNATFTTFSISCWERHGANRLGTIVHSRLREPDDVEESVGCRGAQPHARLRS